MRYKDEFHIAVTAVMLSVAMVGISVVVPKENRVPRAKTTLEEAPETAAEAEAAAEEAGFPIYSQESNYDYDSSQDYSQDYSQNDSSASGTEDPGSSGDTSGSDQITYPSEDTGDGGTDIPDYTEDSSQDYGDEDDSGWDNSGEDTEGDTWSDDTGSDGNGEADPDMVVYE